MTMTGTPDLLVLASHPPELRGLRARLGDGLVGDIAGLRVVAKTVGIGLPVAGAAAAKRVLRLEPRAVVQLGTCGVYPGLPDYRPHDVIVSNRVALLDHAVDLGRSAFPEPMQTELRTSPALTAGLAAAGARARAAGVLCPLAQTRDDELAVAVPKRTSGDAENLETYAIAQACHLAQLPFTAVLGVTHVVGTYGLKDWRQFERQSSIAAADVVLNWLHAGAPGLPHGGR